MERLASNNTALWLYYLVVGRCIYSINNILHIITYRYYYNHVRVFIRPSPPSKSQLADGRRLICSQIEVVDGSFSFTYLQY